MRALNLSGVCAVTATAAGERIFHRGIGQGQDFFWPQLYVRYLQIWLLCGDLVTFEL